MTGLLIYAAFMRHCQDLDPKSVLQYLVYSKDSNEKKNLY